MTALSSDVAGLLAAVEAAPGDTGLRWILADAVDEAGGDGGLLRTKRPGRDDDSGTYYWQDETTVPSSSEVPGPVFDRLNGQPVSRHFRDYETEGEAYLDLARAVVAAAGG